MQLCRKLCTNSHLRDTARQRGRTCISCVSSPRQKAVSWTKTVSEQSTTGSDEPQPSMLSLMSMDGDLDAPDYSTQSALDIIQIRTKWLAVFCLGLGAAACVMHQYEDILEHNVQLAFFVPLLMGHGGNTGSQTVSSIIRALALRQVRWRKALPAIMKESLAGGIMGGLLGLPVLGLSMVCPQLSKDVSITVAVALPLVSLWANGIGALITLAAHKLRFDPAMSAGPLVTTLVDTTGLIIYFHIAQAIIHTQS